MNKKKKKHQFHFYDSEVFSGIEDKETKYYDQRCSHCSYSSENSKGLGSYEPGTVQEGQLYMRNIF